MNDNIRENWERFLHPESLRGNLILASLYIATFEILKNSIIGRIRDFFWKGFDESGDIIDPVYATEVLARNRSPLYASLDWLKGMNAISDDDILVFDNVKKYRNAIAHEIARMLSEGLPPDFPERFNEMLSLLNTIELWWIVNFEMTINPDLVGREIDEEEIVPGPVASVQMMVKIALAPDDEAREYYDEFVKLSRDL